MTERIMNPRGTNDEIISGTLSWALNEDAAKTLEIPAASGKPDAGKECLVCIYNGSAVVDLTPTLYNCVTMGGSKRDCKLTALDTVAKGTGTAEIVQAFPLAEGGKITLTKSAATAAAFSAYIKVFRL